MQYIFPLYIDMSLKRIIGKKLHCFYYCITVHVICCCTVLYCYILILHLLCLPYTVQMFPLIFMLLIRRLSKARTHRSLVVVMTVISLLSARRRVSVVVSSSS
jgi:hypothetical protein